MTRRIGGAAMGKYLLLIVFLALFVGWYLWKQSYGNIGPVARMAASTRDYIAFIQTDAKGASNLFIVRADGRDLRQLTNDDAPKRAPAWSPDGRSICFAQETRSEGSATFQLFILGQGSPRQLTYGTISKDMPSFRADGKLIGFLSGGAIKAVRPNGTDMVQVYPPPHRGSGAEEDSTDEEAALRRPPIVWFRWAPKGPAMAGIQVMEGEHAAVLGSGNWWARPGNASPSEGPVLVEPESIVVLPHLEAKPWVLPGAEKIQFDWMPDGVRIVAALTTRQGLHALVRFRVDEQNLPAEPILTAAKYTIVCESPVVSPDGAQVAFELWQVKENDDRVLVGIGVIPADLTQPVVVRNASDAARIPMVVRGDARSPKWSPDGTRLVYTGVDASGRSDIWVVSLREKKPVNLTKGRGDGSDPVWSPAR